MRRQQSPDGQTEPAKGKSRLYSLLRSIQTGHVINTIWASEGTALCSVQMSLVKVFLIWPLKAVAPLSYMYWAWRLLRSLSGRSVQRAQPQGALAILRAALIWGLQESFSFLLGLEVFFYLYYLYKHAALQACSAVYRTQSLAKASSSEAQAAFALPGRHLQSLQGCRQASLPLGPKLAFERRKTERLASTVSNACDCDTGSAWKSARQIFRELNPLLLRADVLMYYTWCLRSRAEVGVGLQVFVDLQVDRLDPRPLRQSGSCSIFGWGLTRSALKHILGLCTWCEQQGRHMEQLKKRM
ncbi:unnamed protein product [Symbiodinium sp. CCMP2592]|nr:unnamed protein product [Symbiodinium sp. CCMP2592]